jgi:hypothetical protein
MAENTERLEDYGLSHDSAKDIVFKSWDSRSGSVDEYCKDGEF